ncbi:LysR family transcriptional regulator [Caballeronia hypogeia]|uniref:LysR family transcriptional regulator n=1 Tax=Caballeronia hypogeia TaxID=1777140 RepID=A0A158BMF2_9BURK|nr:LysR substrate-binding domain-containing protein [Caballeronia hypogeia]SAK71235.1 LysR family transcriptional regulator [Caballeronia hypogeia]
MLDLNDLYYFATLVERGSFTAAAQAIGVPKGTLSRRLSRLETHLALRLIDRTTRRFSPTQAGEKLYVYARTAVEQASTAEAHLRALTGEPAGRIRVTCPHGILRALLAPLLPQFLAIHPKVYIDLVASSRYCDLIADGFDIGLRTHQHDLADSSLIARRLAVLKMILVASPLHFSGQAPVNPSDLDGLHGLHLETRDGPAAWTLHGPDDRRTTIHLQHKLGSDDVSVLKTAAMSGLGVAVMPLAVCRDELASGALVRVLPEWEVPDRNLSLVLPASKGLMPAVRAFADFVVAHMPDLAE